MEQMKYRKYPNEEIQKKTTEKSYTTKQSLKSYQNSARISPFFKTKYLS